MFAFSRIMMYLFLVIGFSLSITLGFYCGFVGGLSYIISWISIVNGCLVISKLHLMIGSIKIISSGFIFWFIMGFFLQTAKNFKDDGDAPTSAEAHAI